MKCVFWFLFHEIVCHVSAFNMVVFLNIYIFASWDVQFQSVSNEGLEAVCYVALF